MIKKENPLAIKRTEVEGLFGSYNYILPNELLDISRLLIIYGDNGCGKTTILKLFFYVLSSSLKSGYKTKIAAIKFKKFSILFENGFEIGAMRKIASDGSFEYYIAKNNKKIKSALLKTNNENTILADTGTKEDIAFHEIIAHLKALNITTFYLSDDRKILNSFNSRHDDDEYQRQRIENLELSYYRKHLKIIETKGRNEKLSLIPTIDKLIDWVRNKIISGSRTGEKNSQVVFSDIIRNYITLSETETTTKDKTNLLRELDSLDLKMPPYIKLGLIDDFDSKTIRSSIKNAKTNEQIKFLSTIISPFLEGINAKLNALEIVEGTLNLFINTINDYFSNKVISFHLNTGFSITQNGDDIDFDWLSSGERQLLLLLINTITSTDQATIFIIDEPEISLNIKWQRKLIKTLLAFSGDKKVQFILATHSFELLSAYKNNISKLIHKDA